MIETHPSIPYSLETLSEAVNYNEFVYTRMRPYLGRRVLELGAGIGNLTQHFLREDRAVTSIDIDEVQINGHRQRIGSKPGLLVECMSIQKLSTNELNHSSFDSVVSTNVLEHIPDADLEDVIASMRILLKAGGYAVHWVPAFPGIFGSLDRSFQHYRRYTKRDAIDLFAANGFAMISASYWNMPGFFGWWFYGRILKKSFIARSPALSFDRFVMPVLRRIEPRIWRPFGQSLLIVARKPE